MDKDIKDLSMWVAVDNQTVKIRRVPYGVIVTEYYADRLSSVFVPLHDGYFTENK